MQAIINGFTQLIENFKAIFNIISNFFSMLIHAMTYLGQITMVLFGYIGQMPGWISGFMLATLIIAFIYIVIGRNGGVSD